MKKILIAAPIGDGKEYSINEWFEWIATQSYDNYDVCLCVNGKTAEGVKKKIDMIRQVRIREKEVITLELPYNEYHTTKHRLSYAREMIRKYAIKNDYDYLFWLDTDTIPLLNDAIKMLMDQDKPVISGLYFYKGTKQPVIIDEKTPTNITYEKVQDLIKSGEITKVWGFGFGCLLMKQEALHGWSFDYRHKFEDWSEDFIACELMEEAKIDRWFYARVICRHYHEKDFTIN